MILLPGEDHDAILQEFEKHQSRFYALIGHCVTRYQQIEDFLPTVFNAALGGDTGKSAAIFAVARGLEAKLNIISATLGASEQVINRWTVLLKRISAAANARNQIAHARPVNNGGLVCIGHGDGDNPSVATRMRLPQMELHKQAGKGETVWTLALMIAEAERTSKLFGHLIAFEMTLKGEEPPSQPDAVPMWRSSTEDNTAVVSGATAPAIPSAMTRIAGRTLVQ